MDFGDVGWNGEVRLPFVSSSQDFWAQPLHLPPLPPTVENLRPWKTFAFATSGLLVLARYKLQFHKINEQISLGRCVKNNSWLRGRILEVTEEGLKVFYLDCGRVELHSEAQRLADMPQELQSRPEVLNCALDPTSACSRCRPFIQIHKLLNFSGNGNWLKRMSAHKETRFWLLVLNKQNPGEKTTLMVHIWHRLSHQIHWTMCGYVESETLSGSPAPFSESQIDCIGKRLSVSIPTPQPSLSPEDIKVKLLSESFNQMKTELNQKEGGSPLTRLHPGQALAVLTSGGWERARLVRIGRRKAVLRLVDQELEVEAEYNNIRELSGKALLLPPMLVTVGLFGLESPQNWGEHQREALAEILHMRGESSSSLEILVYKRSAPKGKWLVCLLDKVANNHQVYLQL